jgi:uncharacterized protein
MIELPAVEGFQWDVGNACKSEEKHGLSQNEAEQVFASTPLLLLNDDTHSTREPRFHAYGRANSGRLLQVSFTLRQDGRVIRAMSARAMSLKERIRYDSET